MNQFNVYSAILITIVTLFTLFMVTRNENSTLRKTIYLFIGTSLYIFSGIGNAYQDVPFKFIIHYVIFLNSILLFLKFIFGLTFKNDGILYTSNQPLKKYSDGDLNYKSKIYTILTILFFSTFIVNLLYPNFRINQIWNPPSPVSVDIYTRRSLRNELYLLNLSDTIQMFCFPFFTVYLYKLIIKNEKIKVMFLIILWVYLDYLVYSYLGRYEILIYVIFAYAILNFITKDGIKIRKKHIIMLGLIFISMLPFFYTYMLIRIGATQGNNSMLDSVRELVETEIRIPSYYSSIEKFAGIDSILNFLGWTLFLPIPSAILPIKPVLRTSHIFTFQMTGRLLGSPNYYSILPSVLGESFIIWGMNLYWIHGLIIATVIGVYFKFMEKYQGLSVLSIYYLLMLLTIGRGGAQSYFGTLINGTFSIIMWIFFNKFLNRIKRNKRK